MMMDADADLAVPNQETDRGEENDSYLRCSLLSLCSGSSGLREESSSPCLLQQESEVKETVLDAYVFDFFFLLVLFRLMDVDVFFSGTFKVATKVNRAGEIYSLFTLTKK